jgi:glycerol kinase
VAQSYPHPGWVEQDPMDIWSSVEAVIREAVSYLGISASDICAFGITNQRETTICFDSSSGAPIYPAIGWQCKRTAEKIEALRADGLEEDVRATTGLIPDAYFSASKIAWILEEVHGAKQKAEAGRLLFGTVDTWLLWKLTGGAVHATDYTNASRTMLFDIHKLCWDPILLSYFDIPQSLLPEVKPSGGFFGETTILGESIPIFSMVGDQQAALFGQCCFDAGSAKNTYGTGCFMLMNTGAKAVHSKNGLLTTLTAATEGVGKAQYALEGSVFVAGAAIQWLRDELEMIPNAAASQACAERVSDSGGVYLIPAFSGLGAPYWQSDARGMMVGLTRGTTKDHLIRAALESIAYQSADVLRAMQEDSQVTLTSLKVDGGASANDFLMQFQADITNTPVVRPAFVETTALGAAYLAGLHARFWENANELVEKHQVERYFTPKMGEAERVINLKGWENAIELALAYKKSRT